MAPAPPPPPFFSKRSKTRTLHSTYVQHTTPAPNSMGLCFSCLGCKGLPPPPNLAPPGNQYTCPGNQHSGVNLGREFPRDGADGRCLLLHAQQAPARSVALHLLPEHVPRLGILAYGLSAVYLERIVVVRSPCHRMAPEVDDLAPNKVTRRECDTTLPPRSRTLPESSAVAGSSCHMASFRPQR